MLYDLLSSYYYYFAYCNSDSWTGWLFSQQLENAKSFKSNDSLSPDSSPKRSISISTSSSSTSGKINSYNRASSSSLSYVLAILSLLQYPLDEVLYFFRYCICLFFRFIMAYVKLRQGLILLQQSYLSFSLLVPREINLSYTRIAKSLGIRCSSCPCLYMKQKRTAYEQRKDFQSNLPYEQIAETEKTRSTVLISTGLSVLTVLMYFSNLLNPLLAEYQSDCLIDPLPQLPSTSFIWLYDFPQIQKRRAISSSYSTVYQSFLMLGSRNRTYLSLTALLAILMPCQRWSSLAMMDHWHLYYLHNSAIMISNYISITQYLIDRNTEFPLYFQIILIFPQLLVSNSWPTANALLLTCKWDGHK